MSLTTASLPNIIWKQFLFKLQSNRSMLSSLVRLQLFGLLLSFNGLGMMSNGQVKISYYSADFVMVLTMFWGFVAAIILTTKDNREDDFLFVSNRLSSDLSNMLLLLAASVIGAVTSILMSFLIQDIQYYFHHEEMNLVLGNTVGIGTYIKGTLATVLYIYGFSAIGYLIGACVQWHKSLALAIPALFIGILGFVGFTGSSVIVTIGEFYFMEHNFLLFFVKIVLTIVIFFALAICLFQRREVR